MKKFLKWVAMGFGALVVLFVVLAMTMSPEKKAELSAKREAKEAAEAQAKADQARQEAASMQTISASDYARAIRATGVNTEVKGQCQAACAFAFLAWPARWAGCSNLL